MFPALNSQPTPEPFPNRGSGPEQVFSVAIVATVPYSIAVSKLGRPFLSDRYFFIVVRLLRSVRRNLIAPSRGRKDADHKNGGPRLMRASLRELHSETVERTRLALREALQ